ncbi:Hydrogenase-2 operon protein HybE [Hartmannibacter diazotrophicus]|uniref:Hydrogenase-2 operon protein HybE n=1 Tax=Hartmannibacter diazotrophicus TaxID=1482074 RepID=A0A2C9D153_9HYPH|nr:[NiFe]-hydrogenase assembly chaperone HybE [Hartmannibacter diazotrophicus]SON53953.1 Hydrogenase-2 operon protein HybE [Hartmannibacter diazotrophicus]
MNARFEGSYLGDAGRIAPDAVLECKICWQVYDPALGDESRQIPPGTPFVALPGDWRCPQCDGERDQFMVLDAGTSPAPQAPPSTLAMLAIEKARQLAEAFRDIHQNKMRDTPFTNRSLNVETVGFRPWEGHLLGVLVVPWFMNLVVMPGPADDWSTCKTGDKRVFSFPSGDYEFVFNQRVTTGPYYACSLFSPMADFSSQLQANDTARAVMAALFDAENREDGDRSDEIRAMREADLEAEAAAEAGEAVADGETDGAVLDTVASRRAFLTGRQATPAEGAGS